MELPKNITQIGESDRNCKIYVEDYVISYMKQVNQLALNKEMAVALYGIRKTEGNVMYLFIYGACKLDFLYREARHLSQAQCQEIERLRKKYFPNYEFQGYRLLNGEMVEGFHICEQDICRYIAGYAQFYEKNDSMLAYMLDVRTEEATPEVVEQEKYEMVKRRQEERKARYGDLQENSFRGPEKKYNGREAEEREDTFPVAQEGVVREGTGSVGDRVGRTGRSARAVTAEAQAKENVPSKGLQGMRLSTVAVFAVLCIMGLGTLSQGKSLEEWKDMAMQAMSSLTEQKLPDARAAGSQNVLSQNSEATISTENIGQNTQSNTLIAEDKLAEALKAENAATGSSSNGQSDAQMQETQATGAVQGADNAQQAGVTQGTGSMQQSETPQGTGSMQQSAIPQGANSTQQSETPQDVNSTQQSEVTQGVNSAQQSGGPQGENSAQQTAVPQAVNGAQQSGVVQGADNTQTPGADPGVDSTQQAVKQPETDNIQQAEVSAQPKNYIIKEGDTLIGISVRNYGTDSMVTEICSLNGITNADDIKVGQKILLP